MNRCHDVEHCTSKVGLFCCDTNEHDQAIWNECAQLITNCVIYFNSALLEVLIDAKEQRGGREVAESLKTISPVAWQHINFAGRYEFRKEDKAVDLGVLIRNLI